MLVPKAAIQDDYYSRKYKHIVRRKSNGQSKSKPTKKIQKTDK